MELAPTLGLAPRIVDLVSSGRTLKANGLAEVETIAQVSSRLVGSRAAFKTRERVGQLVDASRRAVSIEQARSVSQPPSPAYRDIPTRRSPRGAKPTQMSPQPLD